MENYKTLPSRLYYLDSIRGLAALMVYIGHFINWKDDTNIYAKVASLVFNANDAVSLFFVLSGMVLSYPVLQHHATIDVKRYYVARFFRLYPGFVVAVLANFSYSIYASTRTIVDVFIKNDHKFWEEIILVRGNYNEYGPGWTLAIELCYSLLMPFLILIAQKNRKLLPWLILSSMVSLPFTGTFLIHFILGTILAAYYKEISTPEFKKTTWYRYRVVILVAAIALFSIRQATRISPLGISLVNVLQILNLDNFFVFTGVASFVFIGAVIHFKSAQHFFERKQLVFIGKISYGLYLVHWVFIRITFDNWEIWKGLFKTDTNTFIGMFIICTIVSFLSAVGVHYFVEIPFMKLGKKIGEKLKPSIAIGGTN